MITTSPEGPDTVRATFCLRYGVGVHDIHVAGEFNDWSPTANPMAFNGYGYVAEITIANGRAYRFRYLIDGVRWQNDWAAHGYAPSDLGGDDSVLDLTISRAPIPPTETEMAQFREPAGPNAPPTPRRLARGSRDRAGATRASTGELERAAGRC